MVKKTVALLVMASIFSLQAINRGVIEIQPYIDRDPAFNEPTLAQQAAAGQVRERQEAESIQPALQKLDFNPGTPNKPMPKHSGFFALLSLCFAQRENSDSQS